MSRPEKKARSGCADLSSVKATTIIRKRRGNDLSMGGITAAISAVSTSNGYLYVVGRMKDLIKTGGINVAPKEIEEILLLYPDVVDAAIVGEPDPEWGEAIKAYVVAREEKRFSETDLIKFCKEYLADYKVPKQSELLRI